MALTKNKVFSASRDTGKFSVKNFMRTTLSPERALPSGAQGGFVLASAEPLERWGQVS